MPVRAIGEQAIWPVCRCDCAAAV